MGRRVLVVIDPQNDFTSLKGNYATRHSGITQISDTKTRLNSLLNSFNNSDANIVRSDYKPGQFAKGLAICIPGTFGHLIDADLNVCDTCVLTKSEHSCFSSEELKQHLKTEKFDTLILCGFLVEYCVKQTTLDALGYGYKVCLVEDCNGTGDDVQHRKLETIQELKARGATVVDSKDLL